MGGRDGLSLGLLAGLVEGDTVGTLDGVMLGERLGSVGQYEPDGFTVGDVGLVVLGWSEGFEVGLTEGAIVGTELGATVGAMDGASVGLILGVIVGVDVGAIVGAELGNKVDGITLLVDGITEVLPREGTYVLLLLLPLGL